MANKPPKMSDVMRILEGYLAYLFPDFFEGGLNASDLKSHIASGMSLAFEFSGQSSSAVEMLSNEIINILPVLRKRLTEDAKAAYEGDPAASSPDEIILSYPGFYATAVYRLAHEIYLRGVPYLPRMMTEHAHRITGIDIHPGARIGRYFFIDHGTGVVIGETTEIGDRVKIYQGVTLGAKSFELSEDGNPVKGVKRHPKIGNNCIIYAGATILGGDTVIGDNCIIGGNVWLTHSVSTGQKVYYMGK